MRGETRLRIVEIRSETHDVNTYVFKSAEPGFSHLAGQSMTLRLPIGNDVLYRTFSIASAPGADAISMTIKSHPNGYVTNWMRQNLKAGDVLEAVGPNGRFTLELADDDKLAFVSAGSGASPLMSMLRQIAMKKTHQDVAWLHWARTADDILFADEIKEIQKSHKDLSVAMFVSQATPGWFGYVGRPRRATLSAALPDFARRTVFCCGPDGFMQTVRAIHGAEGGDPRKFHIENFGALKSDAVDPNKIQQAPTPEHRFQVQFGNKCFEAGSNETILAAATRQNVVIPCGCAAGICGTCKVYLAEGSVEMRHNGGLSPDDEEAGFILACSSKPMTALQIRS